jgi:O-antigen/teichoic acid export membrane protein
MDRRYATYHFQISVLLGLLAALGIWWLFPVLAAIPPHARWSVWILILMALFQSLTQTGLVVAQKEFRFGLLARIEVVAVGVWLVALVGFAYRCEGFIALLLAQMLEHATRFAAVMIACGWRSIGWASGKDLQGYYFGRFARHLLPRTILQALAGRIDYILLNFLSTVTQFGIYERMLQFIRIPWSLSINLVDRVLLVSYSKEQNDPAALRRTLGKSFQFILLAAVGAIGSATLFFMLVLNRLVGSDWAPVILHHWWIALPFTLIIPFVWNLNIFLEGTGQARQLLLNTALALAAGAIAGVLLVPQYGAAGMLVTQAIVHIALFIYQLATLRTRAQGD